MKKLIALLLTVVLLLSVIPMAAATDFLDDSKIELLDKEAVEVMSKFKVISGFPEGTFRPTDTLTRAQAAKILCCVLLGTEEADKLSATGSTFSDVPASHWANKYVEYCASKGIVAGVGSGKFNPDGKLTGFAFGKMLLVALGADPATLTGATWEKATKKQLTDKRLQLGVSVSSKEMDRQSACRLALNAMFCGEAEDPESTLAYKIFRVQRASGKVDKELYGRPYVIYTSDNEDAYWQGTEMKLHQSPAYIHKSGPITGDQFVTALGVTDIEKSQLEVYRNGALWNANSTDVKDVWHKGETRTYWLSDNGVRLEFYYRADLDNYVILHLFYFAEKITAVTEATFYSDGSVETPGSVTFANGKSCVSSEFTKDDIGSYGLIYGTNNETMNKLKNPVEAFHGTVLSGKLTALTESKVTLDGTDHPFARYLGTENPSKSYLTNGGELGDEVNILLSDDNLVVMLWKKD